MSATVRIEVNDETARVTIASCNSTLHLAGCPCHFLADTAVSYDQGHLDCGQPQFCESGWVGCVPAKCIISPRKLILHCGSELINPDAQVLIVISVSRNAPSMVTGTLNNPIQDLSKSYILQIERNQWLKRLTGGNGSYDNSRSTLREVVVP
jgi:hypothetical protein